MGSDNSERFESSRAGGPSNQPRRESLITAAIHDKSTAAVNFGAGTGTGEIAAMKV
jgi:hypothetical protein